MTPLTVTWGTRRYGPDDCYVIEHHSDRADTTVFGPMPAQMTEPFIRDRREMVSAVFDRIIKQELAT